MSFSLGLLIGGNISHKMSDQITDKMSDKISDKNARQKSRQNKIEHTTKIFDKKRSSTKYWARCLTNWSGRFGQNLQQKQSTKNTTCFCCIFLDFQVLLNFSWHLVLLFVRHSGAARSDAESATHRAGPRGRLVTKAVLASKQCFHPHAQKYKRFHLLTSF